MYPTSTYNFLWKINLSEKNVVRPEVWSYGAIEPSSSFEIASEDNVKPNDKLNFVKTCQNQTMQTV